MSRLAIGRDRAPRRREPSKQGTAVPPHKRLDAGDIMTLQKLAGNQAVTDLIMSGGHPIELRMNGFAGRVETLRQSPGTRYRMPTFVDLKAVFTDKSLKIPEDVVKNRVAELLGRMKADARLKSKDDVPAIMAKIFPGPGTIDETAFNAALDVGQRDVIYQSVLDANTTVKPLDQPKLKTAMIDAGTLIDTVEADAAGLTAVFGKRAADGKARYALAKKALAEVAKSMDKDVSTDYNLDDPEVGLGGWANFASRHMHLLVEIAQVKDPKETCATLIHEASHLSNPDVDDKGYYGSPGFEAMLDDDKVDNAAHFEELPRRALGTSNYKGLTFKPGVKKGGGKMTHDDEIHRAASEYLRKAWDAAVDTHSLIRGVRVAALKGDVAPFTTNKAVLLKLSKLMDLTIHEQDPANQQVTQLDVTISESIAHGITEIQPLADAEPVPKAKVTDTELRDLVVTAATCKYANLLKDPTRDAHLLDWFVTNYRNVPSP